MTDKTLRQQLREEMKQIGFNQSQFQIQYLAADKGSPARLYRWALIQIDEKLNALENASFCRRRVDIDIQEIQEKLKELKPNSFEAQRLMIDLEEKELALEKEIKLIEDAAIELSHYVAIKNSVPAVNRDEFEKQELGYWQQRLIDDARLQITTQGRMNHDIAKALEQVGVNPIELTHAVAINTSSKFKILEQQNKHLLEEGKK
jgi:hypothetical protein